MPEEEKKPEEKKEIKKVKEIRIYGSKAILSFKILSIIIFTLFGFFLLKAFQAAVSPAIQNGLTGLAIIINFLVVLWILIGVFAILTVILQWSAHYYKLTRVGITAHKGVLMKNIKTIDYQGIRSVILSASIAGKMFNYGTLYLDSPVVQDNLRMINIPNPKKWAQIIEKKRIELIEGERTNFIPI